MNVQILLIAFWIILLKLPLCALDKPVIAPLLPLNEEYPVTLSLENRKTLIENPEKNKHEAIQNWQLYHYKTFPLKEFGAIILFGIIVLFVKFQKKKEKHPVSPNIHLLKAKGIKALNILKNESLKSSQDREQFYLETTNLVRNYIEDSFHIKTSAETTQDVMLKVKNNPNLSPKIKQSLSRLLANADQVKFAHHDPSGKECDEAFQAAKSIIEN